MDGIGSKPDQALVEANEVKQVHEKTVAVKQDHLSVDSNDGLKSRGENVNKPSYDPHSSTYNEEDFGGGCFTFVCGYLSFCFVVSFNCRFVRPKDSRK